MRPVRRFAPLCLCLALVGSVSHAGAEGFHPVKSAVAFTSQKLGVSAERRLAHADFERYLTKDASDDVRTFHAGAEAQNGVPSGKIARVVAASLAGASFVVHPALGFAASSLAVGTHKAVQMQQRAAASDTVRFALREPGSKLDGKRVDNWIANDVIHAYAKNK